VDSRSASPQINMRLASIDIGTNTILMLIADVKSDGTISVIEDQHIIARLGKGVDKHGVIQQETFHRVHNILAKLKNISDTDNVQQLTACGTSALRDAANRQEFIAFIKERLSIDIQILSGQEEAELTYLGTISEYLSNSRSDKYAVLDIGGGSTELVEGNGMNIASAVSIDIGSVRLTERILKKSPPDNSAIEDALQFVHEHLQFVPVLSPAAKLVGVAGTLTTLAALDLRLTEFDRNLINRHSLTLEIIENIFQELRPLTLEQLRSYPQIHHSRADIILAGIIILKEIMRKLNSSAITVSERGLRYGILLDKARKFINAL